MEVGEADLKVEEEKQSLVFFLLLLEKEEKYNMNQKDKAMLALG